MYLRPQLTGISGKRCAENTTSHTQTAVMMMAREKKIAFIIN